MTKQSRNTTPANRARGLLKDLKEARKISAEATATIEILQAENEVLKQHIEYLRAKLSETDMNLAQDLISRSSSQSLLGKKKQQLGTKPSGENIYDSARADITDIDEQKRERSVQHDALEKGKEDTVDQKDVLEKEACRLEELNQSLLAEIGALVDQQRRMQVEIKQEQNSNFGLRDVHKSSISNIDQVQHQRADGERVSTECVDAEVEEGDELTDGKIVGKRGEGRVLNRIVGGVTTFGGGLMVGIAVCIIRAARLARLRNE